MSSIPTPDSSYDAAQDLRSTQRLAALARYDVLDTPREASFDELAELAADLCDAPIAVVNLIAGNRQFFKAEVGLGVRETPLDSSFCIHALLEDDFLLVPDATQDARFACNPLVTGEPKLRFYAGALLKTADGVPIGTLCVLDYQPRSLTALQQKSLRVLARQVMAQLDLHREILERDHRYDELTRTRNQAVDSEARFRNMADHAPVMLWVTDANGACTYLNQRWYEFTGQTPAEAVGLGWLTATHPDDSQRTSQIFLDANAARTPFRLEYRLRHADGSYHWAIDAALPRFGADGTFLGYIGSVIDIQDRRHAEEQLTRSEARYRTLFESIESGFCVVEVDLSGDRVDYRVVEANPAFFDQTGFPQAIVNQWLRTALPELEEHWYDVYGRVARTGEPMRFEQGSATLERWFDVFAFRTGDTSEGRVAILFNDISARRKAEEALQRLNETLEQQVVERTAERDRIWDTSPDLMLVSDFSGVFRRVNPAWTSMLGYEAAELIGRHVTEFVVADDHDSTIDAYRAAAAGGRPTIVNRYRHKDGSTRWISWVSAPASDVTYSTGRDITAEREQALALAHTEEQLRQAQKMEAVGQLTGGIAHDFNNLLTGVIGSLDLLQRQLARGQTDKLARYATAATTSANRAAALTHRLLAFSRRQPLDPKAVNANRLVSGMEDLLRRTIGENIALEIVTAGGLWQSMCDPHQLESAVLNLVINGRDAMPDGGALTIETCNAHIDLAYAARLGNVRPGQYVCVCVTDTGAGMTKDTIARAFEPFFTTKPIGQGTGLGLSMIYGFARQSEGYAKIYSEVGRGTTVKLYLPRFYGDADSMDDEQGGLSAAQGAVSGEVVLVIEDETVVRDLVVEVLQDLGCQTMEAADGPSGLRLLQSQARIDLLITDIGLPGLNGRQVVDAARVHRPTLKVLFMTGYAENATIANGFLEPGMQMITKPFALDALMLRIREMIKLDHVP